MEKEAEKILIAKLRQPIHISYISKYILKMTDKETKKILDEMIEEGLVEISPLAPDYYVNKQ